MKISIVIPAYNEEGNIGPVCRGIRRAMEGHDYEIVAVDDGSTDGTHSELSEIDDPRLVPIRLAENMGKCLALYVGIRRSRGDVIATIDADGQSDPGEIIPMARELDNGYGMVCGWRRDRKDGAVRRVSSRIGNLVNNAVLGVGLHDSTCPLKVFRRECVSGIKYFRNYHRFLPFMIKSQGFSIKERGIRHYPRVRGYSKYGVHDRIFGNMRTMLNLRFRRGRFPE